MERIVCLDRETIRAEWPKPAIEHTWHEYEETSFADMVDKIHDATVLVINKTYLHEEELQQLPHLKLIVVAATGYDRIDVDYCRRRGIVVTNVPNYARYSVPEHALMLMMALKRNLIAYRCDVNAGRWQKSKTFCLLGHEMQDLCGLTLGIIGYGVIGKRVEVLARAFGMKILIAERKDAQKVRAGRVRFEEVIRGSDIITLHCPLTDETRVLIGREDLATMKQTAILINCARGGVTDEAAVVEALTTGQIAGAGIDTLSREPPVDGNPLLDIKLPNLLITPHNAWASDQAMQRLAEIVISNIEAFVRGTPQNVVS
ncbi:MAG: D-2-hydroxyacid dehydrogenase [Pyrinomonadaceae bacterium]